LLVSFATNAIRIPGSAENGESGELTIPLIIASLLVYAILGGMIGLGQWLELRNQLPRAGWWILASAGGWLLGFGLASLGFALFAALPPLLLLSLPLFLAGIMSGAAQWFYLRDYWSDSTSWILVSGLTVFIGGFSWLIAGVIGGSLGWTIAGAISGYMLLRIRNRSIMG
jgi:hypothetical protein